MCECCGKGAGHVHPHEHDHDHPHGHDHSHDHHHHPGGPIFTVIEATPPARDEDQG